MDWFELVERDHEIQNPTSPDKICRLGDYLRINERSRVLDVACGKGGPALVLAATFGCRVFGIEKRAAFAVDARRRIRERGLEGLVEVATADAATFSLGIREWDVALCLGASFVWGHIGDAARALIKAVRPGGSVAVGEPFWREWPLPPGIDDDGYVDLAGTVARLEAESVVLTGLIAASEDDWDHYESLHWRAIEEELAAQPDAAGAADLAARHRRFRDDYLGSKRARLGWAIFVGRTTEELASIAARP